MSPHCNSSEEPNSPSGSDSCSQTARLNAGSRVSVYWGRVKHPRHNYEPQHQVQWLQAESKICLPNPPKLQIRRLRWRPNSMLAMGMEILGLMGSLGNPLGQGDETDVHTKQKRCNRALPAEQPSGKQI